MYQIKIFFWELFYIKFTEFLASWVANSQILLNALRKIALPEKFKSRIIANLGQAFTTNEKFITEINAIKFEIDLQDDVQRGIYFNAFENRELALIKRIIPPNAVCLDVGANIGVYTLNISKFCPNSTIHTFEPDPKVMKKLKRNCQINHLKNQITHHPIALSDQTSKQQFFRSDNAHLGCGSLAYAPSLSQESIEIQTKTLDGFLEENGITEIDFLKIDIEGHELEMLKGAWKTLENKRVKYILIEFNGEKLKANGYAFHDFFQFFFTSGYRPTLFNLNLMEKLKRGKINPDKICTNFLFTPQS